MISIRVTLFSSLLLFSSLSLAFAIPDDSPASPSSLAIDEFFDRSIRIKSDVARYLDAVDEGAFRIHEAPAAVQEAAEKIYYLTIFLFQQNAFHLPEAESTTNSNRSPPMSWRRRGETRMDSSVRSTSAEASLTKI